MKIKNRKRSERFDRKADNETERISPGWDEDRVQSVISYYEQQTEDEAIAEDEAASQNEFSMLMEVFAELGPTVCEWILEALVESQ